MNSVDEPRLCYTDTAGRGHELVLSGEHPRVTVGRSPQTDLAFESDEEISQLHAIVEWMGSHWTVIDDGLSRNGTFVNGDRITGRRRLRPGDSIRIGAALLTFSGGTDGRATRVAAALPTRRSLTHTQQDVLVALCRPYKHNTGFANPAPNQQIAEQLYLSVDAIKTHLRALFTIFAVEDLPPNQKRVRLVERAMSSGIITTRDL